ncbi:hypothetical protein BDZ89DRAFT_1077312 [Hymenopellis radicata]|nr:hypothetical protein BDZ89DRAFT_1077312 [Hymenopellis radicata]
MTRFAFLSGHILPGNVDLRVRYFSSAFAFKARRCVHRVLSTEYQADLITRFVCAVLSTLLSLTCLGFRFKNDFVEQITVQDRSGRSSTRCTTGAI